MAARLEHLAALAAHVYYVKISNSRLSTHDMFIYMTDGGGGDGPNAKFNFGNPSYEKNFQYTDANGYGKFQYSVPNGYYALCSKNIGEFG